MAIEVHFCPRCDLRFANLPELRDHFDHDHHADPDTFSRYRYGRRPVDPAVPRTVVVANQTLLDDELLEIVRDRARRGPVVLLVPATHSAHLTSVPTGAGATEPEEGSADDVGLAAARWRLRTAVERLESAGVEVEGRIAHPEPVRAVSDLVDEQPVKEIVLSTLPAGLSRWLTADLSTRLQRLLGISVTTVTRGK